MKRTVMRDSEIIPEEQVTWEVLCQDGTVVAWDYEYTPSDNRCHYCGRANNKGDDCPSCGAPKG